MDELGLGYEDIKKENPAIIYSSISGFGATGPYAQRPGYDLLVSAVGGLMGITGDDSSGPIKVWFCFRHYLLQYFQSWRDELINLDT